MEFSSIVAWAVAVFGTVVAGLIVERLRSKPNLLVYFPSHFGFDIPGQGPGDTVRVNTSNVVVQNAGGAAASNVTVVFNHEPVEPGNLQIVPARDFQTERLPNGQYALRLGTMAPGETASINTLYYSESLRVENVRSDSTVVKSIPVNFQRAFPRSVLAIVAVLMALGFGTILYWGAKFGFAMWATFAQLSN